MWSNSSLWNADVSGDLTQTLGKKVSAAARPGPELASSLALCAFDPVTHFSVAHYPHKLEVREMPI